MTTLKRFAVAALVAAVIGVGGIGGVPTAAAAPLTCAEALAVSRVYSSQGNALLAAGHPAAASYWYGRAVGILEGAC
jgi:hypothetical protein